MDAEEIQRRIDLVNQETKKKIIEADDLLSYLQLQKETAKKDEELEEEHLKKKGIIIGQHVPSLKSKLDINPDKLMEFKTFSSNILVAKDLIEQNYDHFLRRTGNKPITDLAETKRLEHECSASDVEPDVPHYVYRTKSTKVRENGTRVRFSETLKERYTTTLDETIPQKRKFVARKKKLSAIEREENDLILKSIQHKMNYLRNPRNNPTAVTKMLTKSKAYFDLKASNQSQNLYGKYVQLTDNPLFCCIPSIINFTNYETGKQYSQSILFRNTSAVSRLIRVLQPSDSVFSLSPLKFPPNCTTGMVAPGMCVSATLKFLPTSLGDVSDTLQIDTESGSLSIPIIAQREAPQLSIPSIIDIGSCLVGDAMRSSIVCTNNGGAGKFKLFPYDGINPNSIDMLTMDWDSKESMQLYPFTIYPTQFILKKNDSIEINVEFVPLSMGEFEQQFYMKCDNDQIRAFIIKGKSREVSIQVIEMNKSEFDSQDPFVFQNIVFPPHPIGSETSQSVMLVNDSGIPIEYEWVWVNSTTSQDDLTVLGQQKVRERIKTDQEITGQKNENDHQGMEYFSPDGLDTRANPNPDRDEEKSLQIISENKNPDSPDSPPMRYKVHHNHGSSLEGIEANGAKESLLQSLQMDETGSISNRVTDGEFEIYPARGVLAPDGMETFHLSFVPMELQWKSSKAVMMLKGITLSSCPYPRSIQEKHLEKLYRLGHGLFPKLCSWLVEMSSEGSVKEYVRPNGDLSTIANFISIPTIMHLILNQTIENAVSVDVRNRELQRVNRWIKKMADHVLFCKMNAARLDGDSLASLHSTEVDDDDDEEEEEEEGEGQQDNAYDGAIPGRDDETSTIADQTLARTHQTHTTTIISLYNWVGDNETTAPEPILPVKIIESSLNTIQSNNNHDPIMDFDLSEDDRELVNPLWITTTDALRIIGSELCEVLDSKVQHAAVDYIRECVLTSVASINFDVGGEGVPQRVILSPPVIPIGSTLAVGQTFQGSFSLINMTTVTSEIEMDLNNLQIKPFTDLIQDSSTYDFQNFKESIKLKFNINRVNLYPMESIEISYNLTVFTIGKFELTLPFTNTTDKAEDGLKRIDPLRIIFSVNGAHIRFDASEVDLGLMAVGNEGRCSISFTNDGNVPASFMFKPHLQMEHSLTKDNSKSAIVSVLAGNAPGHIQSTQSLASARSAGSQQSSSHQGGSSVTGSGILSRQNSHRDSQAGGDQSISQSSSRLSTFRSEDGFSIAESKASSTDFHIELKSAVVSIEPISGLIAPQTTLSVTIICKAGKNPQRLRGYIECVVLDGSNNLEITSEYLNLRGEIQAPKTILYPMYHNLGFVYVGMPVTFTVTTENLCNLPTKYKLLRPGGESSLYKLSYDRYKGSIGAKEKVSTECTFTASTVGLIDDCISNKVFGAHYPLGFVIKAVAKGISVEFKNLGVNETAPLPLASPDATQYPDPSFKIPDPLPTLPIQLGENIPLYERRFARFVIRNLSAIPIPFEIIPRKYQVKEKFRRFGSSSAANPLIPVDNKRKDLVLAPHEYGFNKFHSKAGKKYLGFVVQREEDRKFLYSGLGASYHIDVPKGTLPPWGVQEITVRAYNDIPGCYDDELVCTLIDHLKEPVEQIIPIEMSISGCPMIIEKDTVGMSVYPKNSDAVPISRKGGQVLMLGHANVNADPLVREFFVKNNGSKAGEVSWQLQRVVDNQNGPLKLSFSVMNDPDSEETGGNGVIKTHLQYWDDIVKVDCPFVIEPVSSVIKPYEKQSFKVTLLKTDSIGKEVAKLIGSVVYNQSDGTKDKETSPVHAAPSYDVLGSSSFMSSTDVLDIAVNTNSSNSLQINKESRPSSRSSTSRNEFTISMFLEGHLLHPAVLLNGHTLQAVKNPTLVPDLYAIILKTPVTSVFRNDAFGSMTSSHSSQSSPNMKNSVEVCMRSVTIVNPTESLLIFNVSTDGPYIIKDSSSTGSSSSTIGKPLNLLPNVSSKFSVAFNPKKELRNQILNSIASEAGKVIEQKGSLIISFSTGQSLHVPIATQITTPFISGSSPRLSYGICHTSQSCDGLFLLSNPTNVPARWVVEHVPNGGVWKRSSAIRVKGFESTSTKPELDDPDVFQWSLQSGMIDGPTLSVAATMAAPPFDVNRKLDTIVPQRSVKSSWMDNTITLKDTLIKKHDQRGPYPADAVFPQPIQISFHPTKSARYSSRFRFQCEFGNTFHLLLQGEGTYEENMHKPLHPIPN